MTLRRHATTRIYSADVKDPSVGRLHVSLRTTVKSEAMDRHAAVVALVREGHRDLVAMLRSRMLRVEAVLACHRAKRPFETLRAGAWPRLSAALADYLAATRANPKRTERTAAITETALGHFRGYLAGGGVGDLALDHITHDQVTGFEAWMAAKGWKPATRNLYLMRLSALFHWTQARETRAALHAKRAPRTLQIPIDPESVPEVLPTRVRFLEVDEAQRLLAVTPEMLVAPVAIGVYAGLRINEMRMLRPMDVSLEQGLIYIQARGGEYAWQPKRRKERQVPISTALRPLLERHMERFASESWMLPNVSDATAPVPIGTLEKQLRRVVEAAGLTWGITSADGVTYHTLRHTFASWLVMAGVDLFTVARLMGHSSTKQVELTYSHLAPEHRRWAVEQLAERLAPDTVLEAVS